jgi:manganese/zinc/iron transport system permease protein
VSQLATFNWSWSLNGWIVAAGLLSALSCALLGNFLVLRRMSMMGDAISHAVLPGLAIAFLLFDSRGSLVMFLGAAVAGVFTALFTQWVHRFGKVEESASMGVVFTSSFAVGLILIVRALDHVDLDPGCVLYGAMEAVPLQKVAIAGGHVPRAVVTLAPMLAVNVLFVVFFYKELKISSFDPELATTLGINATIMHYLLMTLVAATTVASFESVGSILVIAMLIVPAAAAHLLTDRLHTMILVSLVIAALSAILGHLGAITIPTLFGFSDTNTAGMMAVASGALFTVTMFAAPRHGVVSKMVHRARLSLQILREDLLGLLYRLEELDVAPQGHVETLGILRESGGAGWFSHRLAMSGLRRRALVERRDGSDLLTDAGRREAGSLVRSHRLWESFLHRRLNLATDHVHETAARLEHMRDLADAVDANLGHPKEDPHGEPIPREGSNE